MAVPEPTMDLALARLMLRQAFALPANVPDDMIDLAALLARVPAPPRRRKAAKR